MASTRSYRVRSIALLLIAIAGSACGSADRRPGNDIPVAPASGAGVDTARVKDVVQQFREGRWGQHTSFLVMKDGKLIVEEYFSDWHPKRPHQVQSISKSITSLMVGFFISKGFIRSVDDPIGTYLPNYKHLLTGGKETITIRHLLTMSSGLQWNEATPPYSNPNNVRNQEIRSDDGVAFVLSRPLAAQPGVWWTYNGGGVTVLGEILRNASGLSHDALLYRVFDGLLDRDEIEPNYQRDGRLNTAGGFAVTPRGMAKIGQVMLQRGMWNGARIFTPEWIEASTRPARGDASDGYGYLWWLTGFNLAGTKVSAVIASGYGGQRIVMMNELGLVVVLTALNFESPYDLKPIMENALLPALFPNGVRAKAIESP